MSPWVRPIEKVIEFCGGYRGDPAKILMGGPMMGLALDSDALPVLKQNNAILAFQEQDAVLPAPTACIHCGRCVEGCPMHLMPPEISRAVTTKDIDQLQKLGVMTCMECGTCAYNCPAGRQIVQNIRLGKALVKNAGKR